MTSRFGFAAAALLLAGSFAGSAAAEEHVVKMMNANGKGKFMLFEPEFIKANVGDTVKFVPTNKGHNAEMIPGLWPEGAAEFKGELNQEAVLAIDKPGIYGIKCLPHYPMGMIGMVVAGDPTNKAQLDTYKPAGTAHKRFDALNSEENGAPLFNRAIAPAYPTGSTFKPITAMAALEEGVITPSTPIHGTGYRGPSPN